MLFPGQGSQSPGMQSELALQYSEISDTYAEASDLLGYDLWALVQNGSAEELGNTVITQPAMLASPGPMPKDAPDDKRPRRLRVQEP